MAEYCTVAEIGTLGINPKAISAIDAAAKERQIQAASDTIDGYLSAQFKLPLVSWGLDLRQCCAILTACALLRSRGFSPEGDPVIESSEAQKIKWLENISRGLVRPQVIDSSGGAVVGRPSAGPRVMSAPSRGFSRLSNQGSGSGGCDGGSFGS